MLPCGGMFCAGESTCTWQKVGRACRDSRPSPSRNQCPRPGGEVPADTAMCVCFVTFTSSQMETYRPYCSKPAFKIYASRGVSCKIRTCLFYWIEYLKYACLLERFLVWKKHTSTLFSFSSFLFDCTIFIVFNLALLWSEGCFWWSLFHFPLLRAEFF